MSLAIVISQRDNVATALEPLEAGQSIRVGTANVIVREPVPRGHKVALRSIASGEAVVKYGSPIGTASADIAAGTHVHTHNVASGRGRGDLGVRRPEMAAPAGRVGDDSSAPRIAEPLDDDSDRQEQQR